MSETLTRISEKHPLSPAYAEDGRYVWPERWREAHTEVAALEAENAELKDELQVWTDKGAMFVEQGAKLEAMRRKERARELFDNPPSPHAGLTEWQRWKEATDAAIAAQQEQEA